MANENIKVKKVNNLTIKIDCSKCLSCGACAVLAPNTFELGTDLMSSVKDQGPYDTPETIKQVATGCPGGAIRVEGSSD